MSGGMLGEKNIQFCKSTHNNEERKYNLNFTKLGTFYFHIHKFTLIKTEKEENAQWRMARDSQRFTAHSGRAYSISDYLIE